MSRRPLLVLGLLLAAAFTGCLGDDAPAAETPDGTGPGRNAASGNATMDVNATVDDGSAPMPADIGHQPHLHDYWKDNDRVTIMDEDVPLDQFTATFMTVFNVFRGTPGVGGAFVDLPDGAIVYEGTGQLEFTASWNDPAVTGMGVRYRSAASPDWGEVAPLTAGSPLVVPITPEMSDMPHGKTSKWGFWLAPAQPGQVIAGTVHVRVDIVRMGDIMLFPGHPELFNGAHTLTLYEGSASSTQDSFPSMMLGFFTGSQEDPSLPFAKVVPMETQSMTANLTIKSASANVGQVTSAQLFIKSADTNRWRQAEPISGDADTGVYQFAWLVTMDETDSPYAKESQWRFMVRVTTDPLGVGVMEQCGGCSDAKVDFDATIVAYDDMVDGADELREMRRG